MLPAQLLLPLDSVELDHVEVGDQHVTVHAHSRQQGVACPVCRTVSMHSHRWYPRTTLVPCAAAMASCVLTKARGLIKSTPPRSYNLSLVAGMFK